MKKSKKIAWELAKELSEQELADKNATEEYIRLVAGKSKAFAADVFDTGVKAITAQCQKIAAGYKVCKDIYREEAGQIGEERISEYTRLCRELRREMGLDQDEPAGGNRTGSGN